MNGRTVLRNERNQRALGTRDGATMGPGEWAPRWLNVTFSTAKYTIIQQIRGPRGSQLVGGGNSSSICHSETNSSPIPRPASAAGWEAVSARKTTQPTLTPPVPYTTGRGKENHLDPEGEKKVWRWHNWIKKAPQCGEEAEEEAAAIYCVYFSFRWKT